MMAKIKFKRASQSTRETSGGNYIQHLEQQNNDKNEAIRDNRVDATFTTKTVSDNQQQSSMKSVVNDNKGNKKRRHPAFRLFYHSSSTTSKSSSTTSFPPSPSVSHLHSDSPSSSSSSSSPSSPNKLATTTDIKTLSTNEAHKTKVNEKALKEESKSSRLFSKRLSITTNNTSATSATTSNNNTTDNNKQPHIRTNSSNKQVISIPLPPYELEVTEIEGLPYVECPLCVLIVNYNITPDLRTCSHRTCLECMQRYLKTEINHSRLKITCPICSEPLQQQVIREILQDDKFYFKFESFMLRKVLAAEPDARWCPAPDCGYAVLATGCASCPRLICGRDGCNTEFCYHCKQEWHPNQTCSAANIQRNKRSGFVLNAFNISDLISSADDNDSTGGGGGGSSSSSGGGKEDLETAKAKNERKSSKASQANTSSLKPEDIKECPVCSSLIIKMNDGSCNHMTCSICETNFCWLCMKEISDLHYFSPSGCTFWGKKPWSRKKKLLWRLGMLVGAPICIVFIAGIAVPAIVIGIPVWAARKLHSRLEKKQFSRYRKNAIITGGVLLSFVVSPIISAMALAVGIPILLGYVYGVVPLSLCRSSGGCLSSQNSVENLNEAQHQQSSSSSAFNQARAQFQHLQFQTAQLEYKRQQMKPDQQSVRNNLNGKQLSSGIQATPSSFSDVVTAANNIGRLEVGATTATNQNNEGGGSIGEPSMYMSNISLERCSRNSTSGMCGYGSSQTGCCEDRESVSNVAASGSIVSHKTDDAYSTRALAGSIVSKESGGYTLVPAEVHANAAAAAAANSAMTQHGQMISDDFRDGRMRKSSSVTSTGAPNNRHLNISEINECN